MATKNEVDDFYNAALRSIAEDLDLWLTNEDRTALARLREETMVIIKKATKERFGDLL